MQNLSTETLTYRILPPLSIIVFSKQTLSIIVFSKQTLSIIMFSKQTPGERLICLPIFEKFTSMLDIIHDIHLKHLVKIIIWFVRMSLF